MLQSRKLFVFSAALAFFGFLVVQTGCLLNHSHHSIIRHDEPLRPITFSSESARNSFEAFVEEACDDDSNKSSGSFAIPFLVGLERSRTVSESAIRNDMAAKLDVNGDAHISDYEVSLQR